MAEGAMEASDPNIIKPFGPVAEKLESDEGFFGHGMIGGSCGADSDLERGGESARWTRRGKSESAGGRVIFSLGEKPTKRSGFVTTYLSWSASWDSTPTSTVGCTPLNARRAQV
jgi:hypothetical protein